MTRSRRESKNVKRADMLMNAANLKDSSLPTARVLRLPPNIHEVVSLLRAAPAELVRSVLIEKAPLNLLHLRLPRTWHLIAGEFQDEERRVMVTKAIIYDGEDLGQRTGTISTEHMSFDTLRERFGKELSRALQQARDNDDDDGDD